MKRIKYLMPLWVGIAIYSVAVVIAGQTGLHAYEELLRDMERQKENLDKLYAVNTELTGIRDALQYDGDTIAVYARELGFGSEDERFIRINGLSAIHPPRLIEGELVESTEGVYVADKTLRVIAVCVAGALLLFFIFIDLLKALAGSR
jgi:cell division protein FtsB